jgi:hypothetical protein
MLCCPNCFSHKWLQEHIRGWRIHRDVLRCMRCKMRGCQHSMTIMASASRAVQEPAALAIPVTGPAPAGRSLIAHMPNSGMYAPPAAFIC